MKRVLFPLVAAALALAASGSASASASLRGVVVAKQHGALLVASPRGLVRTVSGRAAIGSRVLVRGGRVVGTAGRARTALIRGVVVRRSGRLVFLSSGRHLLVVHTGRRLASATDTAPAPGTVVQQTVAIDDQGNLDDQGEQQLGQSGQVQIQAQVAAVGTGTVTLIVDGQQLTIPLPAGLTLPASLVGTQVTLDVSFANGQATADAQGDQNQQGDDQQSDTEDSQQSAANDPQNSTGDQQSNTGDQQNGSDAPTGVTGHDGGGDD